MDIEGGMWGVEVDIEGGMWKVTVDIEVVCGRSRWILREVCGGVEVDIEGGMWGGRGGYSGWYVED